MCIFQGIGGTDGAQGPKGNLVSSATFINTLYIRHNYHYTTDYVVYVYTIMYINTEK